MVGGTPGNFFYFHLLKPEARWIEIRQNQDRGK